MLQSLSEWQDIKKLKQNEAGPDLETIALGSCASAELVQEDKTIILLIALLPWTLHRLQSETVKFNNYSFFQPQNTYFNSETSIQQWKPTLRNA